MREFARLATERDDFAFQLVGHDVGQLGIQCLEKHLSGIGPTTTLGPVHTHGLEAGSGKAAFFHAGELPHEPVSSLDEAFGGIVDPRRLAHGLEHLGKEPLTRVFASIGSYEILFPPRSDLVD